MMPRRQFGPTKVDVPVIGQGTWQLRDKAAAEEALRAGLDLGMTHVDTAELYTGSEQVVANVIRGRRDEAFLVSKVLPRNASYKETIAHCEASLKRLETDHLDVYLLHWWSDAHPLEDTMRAMGELVDRGLTRWVGVSNFDVDELEAAQSALGKHKLACNQVLYNLTERGIESEVLPWCAEHDVAVVAYSPFGSTGGFPSPTSRGGKVLRDVAKRLDKTPHQVALAFVTRHPEVFTIPKTEKVAHVQQNAGGAFELPEQALAELEEAFPVKPGLAFL